MNEFSEKENISVYDTEEKRFVLENVPRIRMIKKFGVGSSLISTYINHHSLYKLRYYFYKVDEDGDMIIPEWVEKLMYDIRKEYELLKIRRRLYEMSIHKPNNTAM